MLVVFVNLHSKKNIKTAYIAAAGESENTIKFHAFRVILHPTCKHAVYFCNLHFYCISKIGENLSNKAQKTIAAYDVETLFIFYLNDPREKIYFFS